MNATFRLLAREKWEKEAIAAVNRILMKEGGVMT